MKVKLFRLFLMTLLCLPAMAQNEICSGTIWKDTDGNPINAHGGGILHHQNTYYWYGEVRPPKGSPRYTGVSCYSSQDLVNWKNEGIVLQTTSDPSSPLADGCIIERPKVIYNEKTEQFVLYFHHELKDQGYAAAHYAVATSDCPTGPFAFLKSDRVNPKKWPVNLAKQDQQRTETTKDYDKWWTKDWYKAVEEGLFVRRDFDGGQMARDCTLFVDDDGKAYHIYSSEENLTLHIAELSDDYLSHTGKYIRIAPGGHNEAPALFKHQGMYYMITSGCTGWAPNAARLLISDSILGNWKVLENPCLGEEAQLTFRSQGTYILPLQGKKEAFIFMADRWNPDDLYDSRYIWLPILFENSLPIIRYQDKWNLTDFTND